MSFAASNQRQQNNTSEKKTKENVGEADYEKSKFN